MVKPERIRLLNSASTRPGRYVLYWMQQSQRAVGNPALALAIERARTLRLPLVVCFGLDPSYPEANARHYTFMLQGLQDVMASLHRRRIAFVIRTGRPYEVALELAADAALLVVDCAYLRHLRQWREEVARRAECPVIEVEGDAVVPVAIASGRPESAARYLRPKLHARIAEFTAPEKEDRRALAHALDPPPSDVDLQDVHRLVQRLGVDASVKPVRRFKGGTTAACKLLDAFLSNGLAGYAANRNEPGLWQCSLLSPYIHFGQISPVDIVRRVSTAEVPAADRDSFLDELVVRRELGLNYVTYRADYDALSALPFWARSTLAAHARDRRSHVYSVKQLETGDTHDRYWNAAAREMVHTGYMHNYMRMYWAKKILEWSPSPESAFKTTLYLMNKYFLDGRDPLSYSNVAWCFGLHDRPWFERPIFGTIRYMAASGLERKFDMDHYMREVERLVEEEGRPS